MSNGEPCTSEYVTLLQSFHRGTLRIHWYIAQNVWPTLSLSVLFSHLFRTVTFSRFSKVAIATSKFMSEFYNGGFSAELTVLMLKEIHHASSRLRVWNEEIRSKTSRKIYIKTKHDVFFQWPTPPTNPRIHATNATHATTLPTPSTLYSRLFQTHCNQLTYFWYFVQSILWDADSSLKTQKPIIINCSYKPVQ